MPGVSPGRRRPSEGGGGRGAPRGPWARGGGRGAPPALRFGGAPAAIELRRALAQPGAAVGALRDVRRYLGPTRLADDEEVGAAGGHPPVDYAAVASTISDMTSRMSELASQTTPGRAAPGPRPIRSGIPSSSAPDPRSCA